MEDATSATPARPQLTPAGALNALFLSVLQSGDPNAIRWLYYGLNVLAWSASEVAAGRPMPRCRHQYVAPMVERSVLVEVAEALVRAVA